MKTRGIGRTSAALALVMIAAGGCCGPISHHLHRHTTFRLMHEAKAPYYHCGHCGQLVPQRAPCPCQPAVEPAFFGFEATCWRQWPEGWVGCPIKEVTGEFHPAEAEVLPASPKLLPPTDEPTSHDASSRRSRPALAGDAVAETIVPTTLQPATARAAAPGAAAHQQAQASTSDPYTRSVSWSMPDQHAGSTGAVDAAAASTSATNSAMREAARATADVALAGPPRGIQPGAEQAVATSRRAKEPPQGGGEMMFVERTARGLALVTNKQREDGKAQPAQEAEPGARVPEARTGSAPDAVSPPAPAARPADAASGSSTNPSTVSFRHVPSTGAAAELPGRVPATAAGHATLRIRGEPQPARSRWNEG